jgi:hemerythrin-like domain-containing protein
MKRSEALAPLSRDHHYALVVASALTRADQHTARSSAMLFADFILDHVEEHFGIEEALLLPALPDNDAGRRLAARVLDDHRSLRAAAADLRHAHDEPDSDHLQMLGARLRSHVQLEERELFPCLETSLDEASLARLGADIAQSVGE